MRILLIEDWQWSNNDELNEGLKNNREIVIVACDFSQAARIISKGKFDCIAIDSCRGHDRQINTAAFVYQIKKIYDGTLIAISNIPYSRIELLRAGCTYGCSKINLAKILIYLSSNQKLKYRDGNILPTAA